MKTSNKQISKKPHTNALSRSGLMAALAGASLCLYAFAQTPRIADSTAQDKAETTSEAKAFAGDKEKLSYAYGATTGNYFRRLSVEIDPELFMQGVNDALAGGETRLTMEQARAIVDAAQKALKTKQQTAVKAEQAHAAKVLAENNSATELASLKVSYKLDPRVTSGTYSGERWVSPPTFTRVLEPKSSGIDIRVRGLSARGGPVEINPQWVPGDPSIVTISAGQSGDVKLTVHRAGETSVRITSDGVFTELAVEATPQGAGLRVDIRQAASQMLPAQSSAVRQE